MKLKFSILLLTLLCCFAASAQFVPQSLGGGPTIKNTVRGAFKPDSGVAVLSLSDTIRANRGPNIKKEDGLLLKVKDTLFMRDTLTKRWVKVGLGSSGSTTFYGVDSVKVIGGNTVCVYQGGLSNCYALQTVTADTTIAGIDSVKVIGDLLCQYKSGIATCYTVTSTIINNTVLNEYITNNTITNVYGSGIDSIKFDGYTMCVYYPDTTNCYKLYQYIDSGYLSVDSLSYIFTRNGVPAFSLPTLLKSFAAGDSCISLRDSSNGVTYLYFNQNCGGGGGGIVGQYIDSIYVTPDSLYQVVKYANPVRLDSFTYVGGGGGSGGGTVTDFTAGTLSPLFTTSVSTSTSTPALSFTLSNAAGYTNFGNNTSSSGAPAFNVNRYIDSMRRQSGSLQVEAKVNGEWRAQFTDSTQSQFIYNWSVIDSLSTPPGSPAEGDIYLVGTSPTGVWVTHNNQIATYTSGAWTYETAATGNLLYNSTLAVVDRYSGSAWVRITPLIATGWATVGNLIGSGIGKFGTINNKSIWVYTNNRIVAKFDSTGKFFADSLQIWRGSGTERYSNVAIGDSTLNRNTTGHNNTAVGDSALNKNTTGNSNTSVGVKSLAKNTTGNQNSAFGDGSLFNVTTGNNNVAIGVNALSTNTTSSNSTAVGSGALNNNTSGNNTAVGYGALFSNSSGGSNVSVGAYSLYYNTTGIGNVAMGLNALINNTTGNNLMGIGSASMTGNTTGSQNVSIGESSGYSNTTGIGNTAIGGKVLFKNSNTIATFGAITGGSSYTNGTYNNVTMTYVSGTSPLYLPTANITVSGGAVTSVTIVNTGGRVTTSTVLSATAASIGGTGSGFSIPVASVTTPGNYNTAIGDSTAYSQEGGSYNLTIGAFSQPASLTGSGQLNIGNVLYGTNLYQGTTASSTPTASGSIGIGVVPVTSAKLQVDATDKGMLAPRMTKVQRDAIASPAQGLLVFVTDNGGYLSWYNSGWFKVTSAAD